MLKAPMFRAAVLASAAHLAALASMARVRTPQRDARTEDRTVELTIEPTTDSMLQDEDPIPTPTRTLTPTPTPTRAPIPTPTPDPTPTPTPTPGGGVIATADSTWTIGFRAPPPSLALPLPSPGAPPAPREAEPPPAPAKPASTTGGLAEALADGDRDLGLGRGGPVVAAARDEAYRAPVPNESSAKIRVLFDREGHVVSADLVEASAGGDAWRDVARAIARSLAGRPLTLPASARGNGLEVTVLVVSKVRLPSGAKPGQAFTLTPLGGVFDLADVGARPRRIMSARVLEERWR